MRAAENAGKRDQPPGQPSTALDHKVHSMNFNAIICVHYSRGEMQYFISSFLRYIPIIDLHYIIRIDKKYSPGILTHTQTTSVQCSEIKIVRNQAKFF